MTPRGLAAIEALIEECEAHVPVGALDECPAGRDASKSLARSLEPAKAALAEVRRREAAVASAIVGLRELAKSLYQRGLGSDGRCVWQAIERLDTSLRALGDAGAGEETR